MADVGDFEVLPCDCPSGSPPVVGPLLPSASDVGEFEVVRCDACPVVAIVSPAAGPIFPGDQIVFTLTPDGLPSSLVATMTLPDGSQEIAWNFDQPGTSYTGSLSVALGVRTYTVARTAGWIVGSLHMHVDAIEPGGGEAFADRDWTVGAVLPANGAPDLVAEALDHVIIQYRESDKLLQEIRVLISPLQELANIAWMLQTLQDPAVATGVNLDVCGEIVGQMRELTDGTVADDSEYQVLQTARRARNVAKGTPEDLLSLLVNLLGARVVLTDHGDMAFSYIIMRPPTADEVSVLGDLLPRPMGVKVSRAWAPTVYFGYSTDPGASGYGVGHYVEGF